MVRRDRQHQPIGAKGMTLESGNEGRLRADADVGVTGCDGGADRRALAIHQIDVDRRIGRQEIRQQGGQVLRERRGVGKDTDAALQSARISAKVAAHRFDLLQNDAGMVEQAAARLGRLDTAPAALQQGNPQDIFHAADTRARRGERQVGALGAARDAAGLNHELE